MKWCPDICGAVSKIAGVHGATRETKTDKVGLSGVRIIRTTRILNNRCEDKKNNSDFTSRCEDKQNNFDQ